MQRATALVTAFGKLPTHGDFVRHRAADPAVRAFDEWLQRGLFLLKQQRGAVFEEQYDTTPPVAFVFRPGASEAPLVGVVASSRDSAGRAFPFVIAAYPAAAEASTCQIMQQNDVFLREAATAVDAITDGEVGHREVAGLVDELPRDGSAADAGFEQYLRQTSLRAFGEAVWEYFEDSRKYVIFRNLTETFGGGGGQLPRRIGLRFPLDAAAPAQTACFWLEVLERLAGEAAARVTCFWTAGSVESSASPSAPASMLVFMETPAPSLLGDVLGLKPPSERVWDLQAVDEGEQAALAALSLPEDCGRLLEDESVNLHEFVAQLTR